MLQADGSRNAVTSSEKKLADSSAEYIAWIKRALKKPGKNRSGLARALGLHPSQITKLLDGKRGIKAGEISNIATYLEERPPASVALPVAVDGLCVPIISEAAADVWMRATSFETVRISPEGLPKIPQVQDNHFDGLPQFAVKVNGASANAILPAGSFAICVPYWQAREAPHPNDLVIIERRRPENGLIEVSARRLRRAEGWWELWMESADVNFQERIKLGFLDEVSKAKEPFAVDGMEIRIAGLVIWKTQPLYHHYY